MALQKHIEEIRNGLETDRFPNEAAVSQGIILRVLHALGWPRYDSQVVVPKYPVESRHVDFALCPSPPKPIVFIEVKQVGNIHGPDGQLTEEQLFEYAAHKRVPIAVLTDGQKWHFFHPPGQRYNQRKVYDLDLLIGQRKYDQRKVYELDLLKEDKEKSAQRLNRYLNYEAVRNGEATKAIQEDYKQRIKTIKECLLAAWKNLVEGKNQSLLQAMVEKTEKLSEYKLTEDLVLDFLKCLKARRRPQSATRLVVTIDDGETINCDYASDTFVEVIEKLGINRVRDLRITANRIPLISTTKSDKYYLRKSGPYYIMTQTNTKRKKSLLEEIADRLSVSLAVEIVEE